MNRASVPPSVMRFPRFFFIFLVAGCLLGVSFAANPGQANPAPAEAPAILPQQFGGWEMQGSTQKSSDPAAADPTNAMVLKEYRFNDLATATYKRDDGRTVKIRAARFADASGAFGAYTFYLQPEMRKEDIGDQAASMGDRVLFYRGFVLVDAQFSKESPMSGAELRELAGMLPRPTGNSGNLPTFIQFLPRRDYIANTQKYVMGPVALGKLAPPVPADQVDFNASAEVSLATYSTPSGEATLMLISYPTPQMAADHLKRIDAAHQLPQSQSGISAIGGSGNFFDKRSGPLVAVVSGGISDSDAKDLLAKVNYEATVTWNTPSDSTQVHDLYLLLVNIVIICAVIGGLAVIAGVAFGGFRILMKKLYPDKVFDRPEQMEFISLHLTETVVKGGSPNPPEARQNPS